MITKHLHAHFSSSSHDCDGRIDREYIIEPNLDETASEFGDLDFEQRLLATVVSTSGMGGELKVITFPEDRTYRLIWNEQTDEGNRYIEVLTCVNEACDTAEHTYRDHRAESMGY